MSQDNEAAEQQQEQTAEKVVKQINGFRDAIVKSAVDNKLSFDVVFNALSQAVSSFAFDFLLLTQGELTDENVAATVTRFNEQTLNTAKVGLDNMREHAKAQAEADATPKIITEV